MLTRDEINEKLKNDPFIKLWENNYYTNYNNGKFSNEKTRPLSFLTNTQPYSNVPIVLVGAGPSIDENVQHLKEFKDNCIIFCADINIFTLLEKDIKPDFVVTIDPHEILSASWHDQDTSNLTLVCPTTVNPKLTNMWQGNIFFFNQTDVPNTPKGDALKRITKATAGWGNIENNFFVGATMFQIAKMFKPTIVIVSGYDFSYRAEQTYCKGVFERRAKYHLQYNYDDDALKNKIKELEDFEYSLKNLKLNVNDKDIWTTKTLLFYKQTFIRLYNSFKIPVINATEGGILTEIPRLPLKDALAKHCAILIEKKDVFILPKRKRKRH